MNAAKATKARYEIDEDATKAHFKTWGILVGQYGLKAFVRAFWVTLSAVEGFPDAAAIRKQLNETPIIPDSGKGQNCGKCNNGWVIAHWKLAGVSKVKVPIYRRCECKGGPAVDWKEQPKIDNGDPITPAQIQRYKKMMADIESGKIGPKRMR